MKPSLQIFGPSPNKDPEATLDFSDLQRSKSDREGGIKPLASLGVTFCLAVRSAHCLRSNMLEAVAKLQEDSPLKIRLSTSPAAGGCFGAVLCQQG